MDRKRTAETPGVRAQRVLGILAAKADAEATVGPPERPNPKIPGPVLAQLYQRVDFELSAVFGWQWPAFQHSIHGESLRDVIQWAIAEGYRRGVDHAERVSLDHYIKRDGASMAGILRGVLNMARESESEAEPEETAEVSPGLSSISGDPD